MKTNNVYIAAAKRSAIASFSGGFAKEPAPLIAGALIKAIAEEFKGVKENINQVILGSVLTAGQGQAPARQALINGGLDKSVEALTINKVCSSGLKSVQLAAIELEGSSVPAAIIAGGMENMSLSPFLLKEMRAGARLGHKEVVDSVVLDGLWDPYNDQHMGICAELCAEKFNLSRKVQDDFALESYRRANEAAKNGDFKKEITPITLQNSRKETIISEDEEPLKLNAEKVPTLRPAFKKDGTVTAANASSINDGAAVLLVCNELFLKEHSITPIAKVLGQSSHSQDPEWFTTAPVTAVNKLLTETGKETSDIDLFEINEAFSAVALACSKELGVGHEKLNIFGGAVALGHPIGASGARILVTLLNALKTKDKTLGAAGICNGGGEATSILVERIS